MKCTAATLFLLCIFASTRVAAWSRCPDKLDTQTRQALIDDMEIVLDKYENQMSYPCNKIAEQLKTDPAWYDTVVVAAWVVVYDKGAKIVFKTVPSATTVALLAGGSHAAISKPVINAIFGSCDEKQRKLAIDDAKRFHRNLKSGKLTDQQLITACKESNFLHSPLNLITWKTVRDLVTNKSLIPNGLKYLEQGCDHVDKNRSMECLSAVAAHCVKEGYTGGFSQDVPLDSIIELCIKPMVGEIIYTPFQSLNEQLSSCKTMSNLNGPDCNAAAYLICKGQGKIGGIIQTAELAGNGYQIGIMCIRDGRVFEDVTSSDLAASVSPDPARCTSPSDSSNLFCMSTAHRYCVKQGYNGGVMQNTSGSPNFRVLCVEGVKVKAPIQ